MPDLINVSRCYYCQLYVWLSILYVYFPFIRCHLNEKEKKSNFDHQVICWNANECWKRYSVKIVNKYGFGVRLKHKWIFSGWFWNVSSAISWVKWKKKQQYCVFTFNEIFMCIIRLIIWKFGFSFRPSHIFNINFNPMQSIYLVLYFMSITIYNTVMNKSKPFY